MKFSYDKRNVSEHMAGTVLHSKFKCKQKFPIANIAEMWKWKCYYSKRWDLV